MTADKLELIRQQSMEQYGFGPAAMKKVKVCTVCGNPSPSDQQFCTECGHRLPDKTLYDIYKERHVCCPKNYSEWKVQRCTTKKTIQI